MSKETKVKLGIVGLLFGICFILLLIVFLNKTEDNPINNNENNPFQMQNVTEYSSFFSVVNDINQYLYYNSTKNNIALYHLLSEEYITKNNIIADNVLSKTELYDNNPSIQVLNMYYEENEQNILYYVVGNLVVTEYEEKHIIKENIQFFVLVDYSTTTYAVYPVMEKIEEIPMQNKNKTIALNDFNTIKASGVVTDTYICNLYYSNFIEKLVNQIEEGYELLEDNFKMKNYANKEDFINYINSKINTISLEIANCTLINKNNQRIYTVRDANGNSFTFTENSIMNYKVNFRIK